MREPNLHTAPKKIIYLEKYEFARRFEGLKLNQISSTFAHVTNFRLTNLKLL